MAPRIPIRFKEHAAMMGLTPSYFVTHYVSHIYRASPMAFSVDEILYMENRFKYLSVDTKEMEVT